jgi:CxxC motif-containing protein (DUF1111 family)
VILSSEPYDFPRRYGVRSFLSGGILALVLVTGGNLAAQTDPGIRGGAPGAGTSIAGLTTGESDFFTNHGAPQFVQVENLTDGLGPRFNLDSCGGCHTQPAVGGSSPPANNPQFVRAQASGISAQLANIPFIHLNGPVREARFIHNPDGTPDGGVHDLFTVVGHISSVTGLPDTPAGCNITQPNFAQQVANNNVIFRIPTPVFGAGLIEAITDTTIRNNLASDPLGLKKLLAIHGHVNTSGNDGTVTRFGWKAQNKSLLIFAGEAYNVEMGVTNENFNTEREENPNCAVAAPPNSVSGFNVGETDPSDILSFMGFMKFLDQPQNVTTTFTTTLGVTVSATSIANGRSLFNYVGCGQCHTPSLPTGNSSTGALSNQTANLFSDLAVHHMGTGLADGVTQGGAGPDEFRSAPLWGVGQRAFFLHDGRTGDLLQAIAAHSSPGSEANLAVALFHTLSPAQQQAVLNFLRSL